MTRMPPRTPSDFLIEGGQRLERDRGHGDAARIIRGRGAAFKEFRPPERIAQALRERIEACAAASDR